MGPIPQRSKWRGHKTGRKVPAGRRRPRAWSHKPPASWGPQGPGHWATPVIGAAPTPEAEPKGRVGRKPGWAAVKMLPRQQEECTARRRPPAGQPFPELQPRRPPPPVLALPPGARASTLFLAHTVPRGRTLLRPSQGHVTDLGTARGIKDGNPREGPRNVPARSKRSINAPVTILSSRRSVRTSSKSTGQVLAASCRRDSKMALVPLRPTPALGEGAHGHGCHSQVEATVCGEGKGILQLELREMILGEPDLIRKSLEKPKPQLRPLP